MTIPFAIPTLTSARLTLRGPKGTDAGPLGAFLAGPRAAWIGGPWPETDAADWLAYQQRIWDEHGSGSWIVALRGDDTPIGRIGLLHHAAWAEPELAWFLFDGFEGRGFAHEAAFAARAYAQATLGLPPLFSFIEPANLRSRALAERLGAKPERQVSFQGLDFTVYRHPATEVPA